MDNLNSSITILPGSDGQFHPEPELMTETELIKFLRIPDVSKAKNYHNVIDNLKRMHDLPRIHICNKPLYPRKAVLDSCRSLDRTLRAKDVRKLRRAYRDACRLIGSAKTQAAYRKLYEEVEKA